MKTRFVHLASFVLGAAGLVLMVLGQIPKYAAFASGGLLFLADAKKALGANP
jgi:hypothetical protein